MIVNLSTSKLKEILEIVSRFVAKHSTLPVLENIYIKSNVDTIIFRATDMEKYINLEIPANIESEWSITVNARMFLDIVKMIEDEEIKLIVDEDNDILTIKTVNDEFKLKWIPASEYVAVPTYETVNKFTVNPEVVVRWIEKVEYAVTEKNFAPVLTGILMRFKKVEDWNKLIFVWTDSFRLAEYKIDYDWQLNSEKIDVIIPKINISDILRVLKFWLDKQLTELNIEISENLVIFKFNVEDYNIEITSILIQWDFPNYENESVIPTQFNTKVIFQTDLLEKAIKKVLTFTKSENNFVEFQIVSWEVILTSGLTEVWEWKTKIVATVTWNDITLWINGKYILDFLKSIEWEQVEMNIVDSEKPVVFKDIDDNNYTYVVRPLVK